MYNTNSNTHLRNFYSTVLKTRISAISIHIGSPPSIDVEYYWHWILVLLPLSPPFLILIFRYIFVFQGRLFHVKSTCWIFNLCIFSQNCFKFIAIYFSFVSLFLFQNSSKRISETDRSMTLVYPAACVNHYAASLRFLCGLSAVSWVPFGGFCCLPKPIYYYRCLSSI